MSRTIVAFCDSDDMYRERFAAYFVEHRQGKFTVHAFSVPELFLDTLKEQVFDIVVLGNGFDGAKQTVIKQGIPLLLLSETVPERMMDEHAEPTQEENSCARIFRYQSMEGILHEMQVLTAGRTETAESEPEGTRMEIIGVYSPVSHEMQMPFSVVLAEYLSQTKKVLYVNLLKYSGFLELFGLAGEYDLGDITLSLRNKRLTPDTFARSVYQMDDVNYIPPFGNPENLHDFMPEDYFAFLEYLEEKTDYEVLIVDFGDVSEHLVKMLRRCTCIYCPVKSGYFFECRMNRFWKCLERGGEGALKERFLAVNLPFSAKHIRGGGDVRRQLLWSEFGDFVRAYVMGGGA